MDPDSPISAVLPILLIIFLPEGILGSLLARLKSPTKH
jgi:hypothetical protein